MSDAPTFSETNWLAIVLEHDKEHYKLPAVYEFSRYRQFVKDDKVWYDDLADDE